MMGTATGNDGNNCNEDNGKAISVKDTKNYFNHESHDGDSENGTPYETEKQL
jgi:hypothetical protein